jgi:hypothetical protein
MEPEKIEAELHQTEHGIMPVYKLSPENKEKVRMLSVNGDWAVYRTMIILRRQGEAANLHSLKDTNEVFKTLGRIEGLDFAINHLGRLVKEWEQQAKRVVAETKKPTKPHG